MIKPNIIEPVTRSVYNPDEEHIGYLNIFEFNDLRLQIAKERAVGYFAVFENTRIEIRPNGTCDRWPNGFFDQFEKQLRELIDYQFQNTSAKWQELYPNPQVLDPDGWDRTNYDYSWAEEKISYSEYERRVALSTCLNYKI